MYGLARCGFDGGARPAGWSAQAAARTAAPNSTRVSRFANAIMKTSLCVRDEAGGQKPRPTLTGRPEASARAAARRARHGAESAGSVLPRTHKEVFMIAFAKRETRVLFGAAVL